jgi:inosine-uridine nucleoside N-ribohydrolase
MIVKLRIDTDPGIDDAMAILLRHCVVEFVGLASVHGNVRVDKATRNARRAALVHREGGAVHCLPAQEEPTLSAIRPPPRSFVTWRVDTKESAFSPGRPQ